jgi:hypothetical protein
MAAVWATGSKANRAWIYVLTFCFFFLVATTLGTAIFAAVERVGWTKGAKAVVVFVIVDAITYNALQKRRRSSTRHEKPHEFDPEIV